MNFKSNVFLVLCVVISVGLGGCEGVFDADLDDDGSFVEKAGTAQCVQADEGGTATLSCPSGQVIASIEFASYGTPTGSCPNFSSSSCHASTSKSKVEAACLSKQSCTVGANNGVFGDPCGGTYKKLVVAYSCQSPNAAQCVQADEGGTATLSCPSGQVIASIEFASYGTPTGSCPNFSSSSCHASTSKSKVEAACLSKQSCTVGANNGVFSDPCGGTYKKLVVAYSCQSPNAAQCAQGNEGGTATLSCPSGQVIASIEFASYGTPTGSCPNFSSGSCHASTSKSKVEAACLSKQSCSVVANNQVFGDPCGGTLKKLAVAYTCATGSSTLTVYKMEQGQTANRVHFVVIGDGYTSQELSTVYAGHVQAMLDYMFSSNKNAPYPRYKNFINRYRIDIASTESGVDNPEKGIYRNTALGGEATCSDFPRTCQVNFELTHNAINSAAASTGFTPHWRLALLNNDTYQNGAHWVGAPLAVYSARCPGWWDIRDLALHEGAHTWHDLWDEYIYDDRVWPGGSEPAGINVTANSSGSKWSRWLGYKMKNGYEVSVFEGASGYEFGLYRPSFSSKMNGGPGDCHYIGNDCGHNMIGIEKIIQDIYRIVRPVDSHRANSGTLVNPADVWVKVVDPDVIKVDWYINGVLRVPKGSQTLLLKNYITDKGTYQITARCYDEVVEHSFSDNRNPHPLDLVRSGLDKLEQSVSWTVRIE